MKKSTNHFSNFAPSDASNRLPQLESQSSLQYLNLRDVDIKCHFDARHAFLAWHQVKKQYKEAEQTHFRNPQNPIFLIQKRSIVVERQTYFFFESFTTIVHLTHSKSALLLPCIIVDEPEEDVLRFYAWHELVKLVNRDILDTHTGLPVLRKIINENMPAYLRLKFFGSKNLTVPQMCGLIGINQRQFEYQQGKLKIEQMAYAAGLMVHSPFTLQKILERAR